MTEKRFTNHDDTILDTDGEQLISTDEIVDKMNELHEENQHLQSHLNMVREVRDDVINENEQLRNRINDWHQRTFKAHEYFNLLEKVIDEVCNDDVSNQIWKEYEKREKLIE